VNAPTLPLPRTSRLWLARLRAGQQVLQHDVRRGDGLARLIGQGLAEVVYEDHGGVRVYRVASLTTAGVLAAGGLS
jgi:hypothetical protein